MVEPPLAATQRMAFSNASRVAIVRGRTSSITRRAARLPARSRPRACRAMRGRDVVGAGGLRPRNSIAVLIVLAVNWPPQAPAPGQAVASTAAARRRRCVPAACAPTASNTSCRVMSRPRSRPAAIGAAVEDQPGMSRRHSAIAAAGDGLVAADDEHQRRRRSGRAPPARWSRRSPRATPARRASPRCPWNAVADGDGVELHRACAPAARIALLDVLREGAVVEVARHRLDPGVADADDRFGEVLGGEADGAQHRARGRAVGTVGHRRAVALAALRAAGVHVRRECSRAPRTANRALRACRCARELLGCRPCDSSRVSILIGQPCGCRGLLEPNAQSFPRLASSMMGQSSEEPRGVTPHFTEDSEVVIDSLLPSATRSARAHPVAIGAVLIGGPAVPVISGPCAVEPGYVGHARAAAGAGASVLRGCVHKPRTAPEAFQGMGCSRPGAARRGATRHRAAGHRRAARRGARRPAAPRTSTR